MIYAVFWIFLSGLRKRSINVEILYTSGRVVGSEISARTKPETILKFAPARTWWKDPYYKEWHG
jgi:hypothetical protein